MQTIPRVIGDKSRMRYLQYENVKKKWLYYYGELSPNNTVRENQICIREIFNLLDSVFQNKIQEFRRENEYRVSIKPKKNPGPREDINLYYYEGLEKPIDYNYAHDFYTRTQTLRRMGYGIPSEIDHIRNVRNQAEHEGLTVFASDISLTYEETKKYMEIMADTLVLLGVLEEQYRAPEFDDLRLREGDVLRNEYVIGREIGEGGMSRVFESVHPRLGKRVAIKELKPNAYVEDVIRNECDNLMNLQHEQIPRIYDVFASRGTFYIVMDYLDGETLDEVCKKGHLSIRTKLEIMYSVCNVLEYLHNHKMLFLDLKPQNIIVGEGNVPYLIDFGISKNLKNPLVGAFSEGYVAPEVYDGNVCVQTDVYAVGRILKEMVWKEIPLGPENDDIHNRFWNKVKMLIHRCMQKDPSERIQTIAEIKQCIEDILELSYVEKKRQHILKIDSERISSLVRNKKMHIVFIGIITVMIITVALAFIIPKQSGVYSEGVSYTKEENALSVQVRLHNDSGQVVNQEKVIFRFLVFLVDGRQINVEKKFDIPQPINEGETLNFSGLIDYESMNIENGSEISSVNYIEHELK